MYSPTESTLDSHLKGVVNRIQRIRRLNLSVEAECQQALEESNDVLGALALYRGWLRTAAGQGERQQRYAA